MVLIQRRWVFVAVFQLYNVLNTKFDLNRMRLSRWSSLMAHIDQDKGRRPHRSPLNIFLKSSWPRPCWGWDNGAVGGPVAFAIAPMSGFLAFPKPARGLEIAALGTNIPPVLAGGADRRDRDEPPGFSSESCRGLSLNKIGSVRNNNFPASF